MVRPFKTALATVAVVCLCLLSSSCRRVLIDPFSSVDHRALYSAHASETLAERRFKPASVAGHKQGLSLDDCIKLALENNLELQVARFEELTRAYVEESSRARLLPNLSFSGQLTQQDTLIFSYSDILGREGETPEVASTDTGVKNYSTGKERGAWRGILETRWSPTDAALAYYLTKNSRNEKLSAHYKRIKVGQTLIGTVEAAYFRLLGLQQCMPSALRLLGVRKEVDRNVGKLLEEQLFRIEDYHRARQKALRADEILAEIRNEMEMQRNILASALGLSPDFCLYGGFHVIGCLSEPALNKQISEMELIAVRNRPEGYEAGLAYLNSTNDLKRTVVKYFPKLTGFWRYTRDSDKYLREKDWKDLGVYINMDMMEWIANLRESKAARANVAKTEKTMAQVAVGISAQVRTAALKFFHARDQAERSKRALDGFTRVLHALKERHSVRDVSRIAVEEARGDLLEARVSRIRAMGEANAALAELKAQMGINYNEPAPDN